MKKFKVITYQDQAEQYRWRLVAGNGKIIADSAEGYSSSRAARGGFNTVFVALRSGSVEENNTTGVITIQCRKK